ncbi:MAG: CDP-alcohol phosphatidyltransferase family protein [Candidatus Roizmanbacteria bacterium]|nr:MAG: CDP-alcohol phosphatidyltransferase family protein [Candidatus Roizmanbacteria bacterium]
MAWLEPNVKEPLARIPERLGISSNSLTIFGLFSIGISMAILYVTKDLAWTFTLFMLGSITDFIDGPLSRITRKACPFGAWLDTQCDRYVEMIIGFAFTFYFFPDQYQMMVTFAAFSFAFLVTYTKSSAEEKKIKVEWKEKWLFGYPGRFLIICAGMLLTHWYPDSFRISMWGLLVFNVGVFIYRIRKVWALKAQYSVPYENQ